MAIELAPEVEKALDDAARRQGTTADQLADDVLRAHLHLPSRLQAGHTGSGTLADLLDGYVGVLEIDDDLSENTGARFAAALCARKERGEH